MIPVSARLISISYAGSLGRAVKTETETAIYGDLQSVGRVEYYAAYDSGFLPEYKLTTAAVNYSDQGLIDIDTPAGEIRFTIYRTYRKTADDIELWCTRTNDQMESVFTLWTPDKRVTLFGAYLTGGDADNRNVTGRVANGGATLILPQSLQAFVGDTPVGYAKPKAYAALTEQQKDVAFTIDFKSFFAAGDIQATGKYQEINGTYDDVFLVQGVALRNRGRPNTEYLEVVGR